MSIPTPTPRPEYPRPRLIRDTTWLNLNGIWEFEKDAVNSGFGRNLQNVAPYSQSILVPFCPESKLSGIEDTDFMLAVWYRRSFTLPAFDGKRILLHFGAVDYQSTVWVNGQIVGEHRGGYTPFTFDITSAAKEGENVIVLHAEDDTRSDYIPSGKQSEQPYNYGCMYTRSTGIWQTVWVEIVPRTYVVNTKLTPDVDNRTLHCQIKLAGGANRLPLKATVVRDGVDLFSKTVVCNATSALFDMTFPEDVEMLLWDVGQPNLYDLRIEVGDDSVLAYFGMRKVTLTETHLEINDRPVFMRLVLDQGYYPDGIYTAPTDDDLRRDIELAMSVGFNGARLHMKIFEPRLIYWADKLGYILWGEFENWGLNDSRENAFLATQPEFLAEMERDYNSPAIIGWCPFNETSAERNYDVFRAMYNDIHAIDPVRPVIDSSGWMHVITDIYDVHDYEQNPAIFRRRYVDELCAGKVFVNFPEHGEVYEGQPYFVSEFGGTFWDIDAVTAVHKTSDGLVYRNSGVAIEDGNDSRNAWGYGKSPEDMKEFYDRFEGLVTALLDSPRVCGYCYTQLTDVFQEKNGLFAFDRRSKFDPAILHEIQTRKAAIEK